MTCFSRIQWHPVVALILGLGFASGFVPAQADEWNKKTILTVNNRIQVSDTVLDPGQYVLMLADSNSNRHIVQIYDADQKHLIDTVMAIPNYRLQPTGKSRFLFWETPPGTAPALRAWFYPGDNFGQEFRYPSHPLMLEAKATAPPPPVTYTEPAPPPAEVTPPAPEANNQPAPQETQPAPQETQPEVAQNTPPPAAPAPPAQNQQNEQNEQPKPETLPKTASPFPMIGLAGGFLLAAAGLLRLSRSA